MPPQCSAIEPAADTLGESFACAIAGRDYEALAQLLGTDVEFRALTPRRAWEANSCGDAIKVLRTWFGDCDIECVVGLTTGNIADRQHVTYRFRGEHPEVGPFVVEQQAYYEETDGHITWMRILCSGFRADPPVRSR